MSETSGLDRSLRLAEPEPALVATSEPIHESDSPLDGDLVIHLTQLNAQLGFELRLDERMAALCDTTQSLLACDVVRVFLLNASHYRCAYHSELGEAVRDYRLPWDSPLIAGLHRTGLTIGILDALEHPGTARLARKASLSSIFFAPIFDEDKEPLGFITAEFSRRSHPWSGERRAALLAGADLAQNALAADRTSREIRDRRQIDHEMRTELVGAEDRERVRIASEVSDGPLRRLADLSDRLLRARGDAPNPKLRELLGELAAECESVTDELRSVLHDADPTAIGSAGIANALDQLVARTACGTNWDFIVHNVMTRRPSNEASAVIFRIAQQTIRNSEHHANASSVVIMLRTTGAGTTISISDDGRGFRPSDVGREQLGLVSMKARARAAGGRCTIESKPGSGTRIEAWIPDHLGVGPKT